MVIEIREREGGRVHEVPDCLNELLGLQMRPQLRQHRETQCDLRICRGDLNGGGAHGYTTYIRVSRMAEHQLCRRSPSNRRHASTMAAATSASGRAGPMNSS